MPCIDRLRTFHGGVVLKGPLAHDAPLRAALGAGGARRLLHLTLHLLVFEVIGGAGTLVFGVV